MKTTVKEVSMESRVSASSCTEAGAAEPAGSGEVALSGAFRPRTSLYCVATALTTKFCRMQHGARGALSGVAISRACVRSIESKARGRRNKRVVRDTARIEFKRGEGKHRHDHGCHDALTYG